MTRMLLVEYELPSWQHCAEAHHAERASCLEEFIYSFQVHGESAACWRGMLEDALAEVIKKNGPARNY